jgi:hypothetical protein
MAMARAMDLAMDITLDNEMDNEHNKKNKKWVLLRWTENQKSILQRDAILKLRKSIPPL